MFLSFADDDITLQVKKCFCTRSSAFYEEKSDNYKYFGKRNICHGVSLASFLIFFGFSPQFYCVSFSISTILCAGIQFLLTYAAATGQVTSTVAEGIAQTPVPEDHRAQELYCFPTWYGQAIWYGQEIFIAVLTILVLYHWYSFTCKV